MNDDLLGRALAATASAPGRSERAGISIIELFEMFPDDEAARKWFESVLWADGIRTCPYCGSPDTAWEGGKPSVPYRCTMCHGHFSVKTGTVMHRSKIGYQKWAVAIYMFATSLKGVSSMKMHRELHITQKSAWFMVQRLRESWRDLAGGDKMDGPVEIDEAFFGGSESNKHADKKGLAKKTAVVGVKDRINKRIIARPVPETTKARLEDFVETHVHTDAKKYTDENSAYSGLKNHESVKHGVGEYVRGQSHTNGMESFWSLMRRGYDGTFHHLSAEHLHRYVNEFAGRHNIRPLDTDMMMLEIAGGMHGRRLTYKMLIRDGVHAHRRTRVQAA